MSAAAPSPAPGLSHHSTIPAGFPAPYPLTERQHLVLKTIFTYSREHGFPPVLRELGRLLDIKSTNGVNDHLRALERKGMLLRTDMLSRGMRITREGLNELREDGGAPLPIPTSTPTTMLELVVEGSGEETTTVLVDPAWACGYEGVTAWTSTSTIAKRGIFPGALVLLASPTSAPLRNNDVALVQLDVDVPPVLRRYRRGDGCHLFDADDVLPVVVPGQLTTDTVIARAVSLYRSLKAS